MLPVVLLLLTSLEARGEVKVDIDTFTGGTVVVKDQSDTADDGSVTVTITVTPASGYEITKGDVMVAATVEPDQVATTRSPQIALMLELVGDDPDDLSEPRDYTFTVEAGFGAWVMEANFHYQGGTEAEVEAGTYRIFIDGDTKWYLWPSVTTDPEGHPYLTTFNDTKAPALEYPSKGVSYEAFDEEYSLWQVTPVEVDNAVYYQLYNIALQQYVVWSAVEGLKVVHLEKEPADVTHTYFRMDGTFPNCLITPSEAAAGTTLNSKAGDKPFLTASGEANAATGYPNGEPDPDGPNGLMQIYEGTPVWTLEHAGDFVSVTFQKTSEDEEESAALFVPTFDAALPHGVKAYFVTGVNVIAGVVLLREIDYMPEGAAVLLLTDEDLSSGFVVQHKGNGIPDLTAEEMLENRLRVGSETVQPKAYEDYIFFRGQFVMVSGGTLSPGKVFLDLNPEEAAATRSVLTFSDGSGTTAISAPRRHPAARCGWYSLDGRRLSAAPTRKGIYIHDGRKVVIK